LVVEQKATGVFNIVDDHPAPANAKAKQELGWELRYPSWREGFKEELA
jgi:hypothetical protein